MEHIWQSSQKHDSGSFDIAEHLACLSPEAYLRAVSVFPISDRLQKVVPLGLAANVEHLEKDLSKLSGVSGLGVAPAPRQALPLNVDQASLDCDVRPELPEDFYYMGIAIDGKTARMQSVPAQPLKECQELGI